MSTTLAKSNEWSNEVDEKRAVVRSKIPKDWRHPILSRRTCSTENQRLLHAAMTGEWKKLRKSNIVIGAGTWSISKLLAHVGFFEGT